MIIISEGVLIQWQFIRLFFFCFNDLICVKILERIILRSRKFDDFLVSQRFFFAWWSNSLEEILKFYTFSSPLTDLRKKICKNFPFDAVFFWSDKCSYLTERCYVFLYLGQLKQQSLWIIETYDVSYWLEWGSITWKQDREEDGAK